MGRPLSDWRVARSFIGAAAAEESAEMDFNIGQREAIEISSVLGLMGPTAVVSTTTPTPVLSEQSLHIESGTIDALNSTGAAADQFDRDTEVIYEQALSVIAFDGTTEGAGAISVTPSGLVVFAEPILSPINLTHRVDNEGSVMDVGCTLLVYYRYVELSTSELAFQFARRRR